MRPPPEMRLIKLPKSELLIRLAIASLKVAGSPRGTGMWAIMR